MRSALVARSPATFFEVGFAGLLTTTTSPCVLACALACVLPATIVQCRAGVVLFAVKPARADLLQAIAVLVDRGQAPAMLAIEVELLAQAADVRVDRARRHRRAQVPDILEQRIAPDDASLATEQEARKVELALGEFDVATVDADAPSLRIDPVRRQIEVSVRMTVGTVAAQQRTHARQKLAFLGGFDHVIVAAAGKAAHEILFGVARGQEYDRQLVVRR